MRGREPSSRQSGRPLTFYTSTKWAALTDPSRSSLRRVLNPNPLEEGDRCNHRQQRLIRPQAVPDRESSRTDRQAPPAHETVTPATPNNP